MISRYPQEIFLRPSRSVFEGYSCELSVMVRSNNKVIGN